MKKGRLPCRERRAAMTTFDLAGVRDFTAAMDARMERCDTEEGTECAKLDAILRRYAELCREFGDHVRGWGDAVFTGRVDFDPEVERLWREEGSRLRARAMEAWQCGQAAEGTYFILEGLDSLRAAIDELGRLLQGWVTPKLAVGPAAKRWRYPDQAATEEERRRVASLPPRPANREDHESRPPAPDREFRTS
jgi:hypothetical protein